MSFLSRLVGVTPLVCLIGLAAPLAAAAEPAGNTATTKLPVVAEHKYRMLARVRGG